LEDRFAGRAPAGLAFRVWRLDVDWHELNKHRVADLRDMMKKNAPQIQGVLSWKKEQLVAEVAQLLGIEKPHKVIEGIDKTAVKARIKKQRELRLAALEAKDSAQLKRARRKIHRLKRQLRRATSLTS
jgi:hypothetical protein